MEKRIPIEGVATLDFFYAYSGIAKVYSVPTVSSIVILELWEVLQSFPIFDFVSKYEQYNEHTFGNFLKY